MSSAKDFVIESDVLTKCTGPGEAVLIPEGVTKIGWFAFDDCSDLDIHTPARKCSEEYAKKNTPLIAK